MVERHTEGHDAVGAAADGPTSDLREVEAGGQGTQGHLHGGEGTERKEGGAHGERVGAELSVLELQHERGCDVADVLLGEDRDKGHPGGVQRLPAGTPAVNVERGARNGDGIRATSDVIHPR